MKTFARFAVVSTLLLSGLARAQDDAWLSTGTYRPNQTLFFINWEIAGPVSGFGNYIQDTSLRGFSVESRSFLRENFSLGLSFSWNRFNQTFDLLSVPITNGTASGPVYRYADMFGIRGLAHFYLVRGPLQPYLGAGIGGVWDFAFQQVADLSRTQSNFDFIVSPEVGLLYTFARGATNASLNLAFRYTYTTAKVGQYSDASTLSGIVGLSFGY